MAQGKKRIGLVLASIHTGVSLNVWPNFVNNAIAENTTLFIFPGGRVNVRQNYENLRNQVFSLVNEENLDGCISWSSSIRYHQSQEEFERFHAGFEPLPYVTLAFKTPGHTCVEFDAYNGMKALTAHCIAVHGARKIAFLRGPDFHISARARFEGYGDALREAGLRNVSTELLITDHFNWSDGAAAGAQLFEDRSLIPGRDFDTLIGSSDLMTLGAIDYFARHGYHVPADYHAAGFNDSVESRITESPLSTVHLPYEEMAGRSFKILLRNMSRKQGRPSPDVLLNSEVLIRESCGCTDLSRPADKAPARSGINNPEEFLLKMICDHVKLDSAAVNDFVVPSVRALFDGKYEQFFSLYEKGLHRFFNAGHEPENLLKLIATLSAANVRAVIPEKTRGIEPELYRRIFKVREQLAIRARYERERWNTALNELKCNLLGTRDRFSLVQSLAWHLPKIGIHTAAIVLYRNEKTSIFVGGFSADGISPIREQRFSARLLVPPALKAQYSDGVFMVQPLFIENQSLGYFIHNVSINEGVIIEELRSSISYALKGVFQLEETVRARRIAEQAERAKTEFLQVLDNGLNDPLQSLKTLVNSKETETGGLMDFLLAQVDELSIQKTIFDPEELLPKIGIFPLLSGDTTRLAQCFSLLREQYPANYSAMMSYKGLAITFKGKVKREKSRHFNMLLAERIILLHGGELVSGSDKCTVTLPWPALTGQELSLTPVNPQDHILILSDPAFLPEGFFTLPQVLDIKSALQGKLQGRTAFIAWNAAGASPEDLVKIAGLRRKSELSGIPFLCYGMPEGPGGIARSAESLISAVEFALKSPKKGAALFIGSREYWNDNMDHFISGKETTLEKVCIDSMVSFNDIAAEINPLLIVFNTIDIAGAAAIRRHPLTVMVPIVMFSDRISNAAEVTALSRYSRLILCHRAIIASSEFQTRVQAVIDGDEFLPPHTSVLVKKAILYFGQHAESHISRWKLAVSVNVSEDYLTRIFHKEMGLSLWDYLSRYRIFLAVELLQRTDDTIQDIALKTGFQDQAYFCRVFKKIYGLPPGRLRKNDGKIQ